MNRAAIYIPRILKHEGGFVNHPRDPGGATNRGVTIGTLRKLGIDKDGDGDSDIADLRALTEADAVAVFKRFYADAVQADLLPVGLDYAMTDFAVNSGPGRAAQHLQRILGVEADGHIGPKTIAALAGTSAPALINALCDSRMRFLRALPTWPDFGRGWTARVEAVRRDALADAALTPKPVADNPAPVSVVKPAPAGEYPGFWAAIIAIIASFFKKGTP